MPHRAITSSRSPSDPTRRIGAIWSGKIAGKGQQVTGAIMLDLKRSRVADWPLVTL